jgi:hypothetical protein
MNGGSVIKIGALFIEKPSRLGKIESQKQGQTLGTIPE